MAKRVTRHPAADGVTPAALISEQDRPVVGLSRWLIDAHATALVGRRTFFLLTGVGSRVTYPLELLLAESPAARWIVRRRDGRGFYDGLSGRTCRWDGQRFTDDPDIAPPVTPPRPARGPGILRVDISRLYPATESVELGGTAAAAISALTGAEPAGWGVGEPVTQPWSPRELTAFARDRAPGPTSVVVVGATAGRGGGDGGDTPAGQAVGVFGVERVATGVLTRVRVAVGVGDYPDTGVLTALDALTETLAADHVRSMLAAWQPGRPDATRLPLPTPPALPVGMLVGHEALASRGVEHALAAPAASAAIVGPARNPACWCRLDTDTPYQTFTEVMRHFAQ